jgi:threonylcarbamoyladenosine tRNA methylthiotransferase MtaB
VTVRTVAFATLGCRLNQVDTQEIQAGLEARGFRTVAFGQPADVVIVNTCTVTSRADFSDRQTIHRALREHPGARVVVTGCWAQTDPEAVARVRGVALVVGNADKGRLPELLDDLISGPLRPPDGRPARQVSDVGALRTLPAAPLGGVTGRSRAFVKIQEGCQHRCAFCIVPFARGASRSREPEAVLDQVARLAAAGYPEVTLTGVDMGHYGADLRPRTSLAALLKRVVEVPGLRWVRLSSVLPAYFTPDLLEVVTGSSRIAPHLHIPLQSGSDRVLRRMRRPYTAAMYRGLVERLAAAIPGLGLGADVMVGFPGETETDFAATGALVEGLPFTYLHVFPYSDRGGTEATGLDGRVDASTVSRRSGELRARGRAKNLAFRRRLVGRTEEVLVLETRAEAGSLVGLTGNYVEIVFDGPEALQRRVVRVHVTAADAAATHGALVVRAPAPVEAPSGEAVA